LDATRLTGKTRATISPKSWDVQILKLNGLIKQYSQIKWIFSIEVAKDKSLTLFNRNSHAKNGFRHSTAEQVTAAVEWLDKADYLGDPP
jgi:hypothetical protein